MQRCVHGAHRSGVHGPWSAGARTDKACRAEEPGHTRKQVPEPKHTETDRLDQAVTKGCMNAAAAIHAALGLKAVESAAIVGERSGIWSEYRSPKPGKKSPGEAKIQTWLERLAAAGTPLALTRTATGCTAEALALAAS